MFFKKLPEDKFGKLGVIASYFSAAGILSMMAGVWLNKPILLSGGMLLMIISFAAAFVFSFLRMKDVGGTAANNAKTGAAAQINTNDPIIQRIMQNPNLLKDQRITRITAVQNLLQYPEIQRLFFDPEKLPVLINEPRVRELLGIVRDWIAENDPDGILQNGIKPN